MNNKKRASLKTLILLPVFILGALTIICNVMAINNIRTVNSNAADHSGEGRLGDMKAFGGVCEMLHFCSSLKIEQ